jgi:hypothetical protein
LHARFARKQILTGGTPAALAGFRRHRGIGVIGGVGAPLAAAGMGRAAVEDAEAVHEGAKPAAAFERRPEQQRKRQKELDRSVGHGSEIGPCLSLE